MLCAESRQPGNIHAFLELLPRSSAATTKLTKTTFKAAGACGPRFAVIAWTVPTLAGFSRIHNRISTGFP